MQVVPFTPVDVARALLGGAMIGVAASLLWLTHGRVAGISGIFGGLLRSGGDARTVRGSFLGGLLVGGVLLRIFAPQVFAPVAGAPLVVLAFAGALVGFGTQLGGGCTSGHGVCGIGRGSPRSLVATCTFMVVGMATVFVVRHWIGVAG